VLTFLDPASATWRAQQAQNLGGVMMWANYEDSKDPSASIAHAVSEGLNPPPSYQEAMQNSFAPPSYQESASLAFSDYREEINTPPPPTYNEVSRMQEREALSNLSEIEKLFCAHLGDLSKKSGSLAAQKCQIMFDLFIKKNSWEEMQEYIQNKKEMLSRHRNLLKRAATKIFGDNICGKLFDKPKSFYLAERLMEEVHAKMVSRV
jgi:hypothetical protein